MSLVLVAFLLFRIFDFLVASFAPSFIKFGGNFSHPDVLQHFSLPKSIESFANFDGLLYIRIASQGYEQFEQAFFPLYPLLMSVFSNKMIGGLIISNLAFLIGLFVFKKYLELIFPKRHSGLSRIWTSQIDERVLWTLIFLLTFPTAFFFGALYTEGLFFLFVVCSFYFLKKENYLLAGIFGFLAATTRFAGLFLVVPFAFHLWQKRKISVDLALAGAPLAGLLTYSYYLWNKFGDPWMFFTSQPSFGAGRSTRLIILPQVYYRYLKIFLTIPKNFTFFVSAVEITLFSLVFLGVLWYGYKKWKEKNWDLVALSLFSVINILVPTLTGTFLSIPRFALLSLSFFLFLAEIKNKSLQLAIAIIFLLLHTVLLAFFIQGHFVS